MDKSSKFKVYLSSRYRGANTSENNAQSNNSQIIPPPIEETEKNVHILNPRRSPDIISYKNSLMNDKELKTKPKSKNSYNIKISLNSNLNTGNDDDKFIITHTSPNNKRYRVPMIPQNKMSPIKHYDDGNSLLDINQRNSMKKSRNANNVKTEINNQNSQIDISIINSRVDRSPISHNNSVEKFFSSPVSPPGSGYN